MPIAAAMYVCAPNGDCQIGTTSARVVKLGIGMFGVELRREHRGSGRGLGTADARRRRPIVISHRRRALVEAARRNTCGCIMIGANTSMHHAHDRATELGIGDADDGQRLAIEEERLADHVDRRRSCATTARR